MSDPTTTADEGLELQKLRERIRMETEAKTQQAVEERIEDEKRHIRTGGDGGIMGFIMGIIFQIAEALGLDKWLAKMVGSPIPEDNEVKALSSQVSQSVSETLTAKQYASAEEMQKAVSDNALATLMAPENRQFTSSFSNEQIAEAAKQAGANAAKQFNTVSTGYQMAHNADHPAKVEARAATGDRDKDVKQFVKDLIDNTTKPMNLDEATRARLADIGADIVLKNPELVTDASKTGELANKYADAILADAEFKKQIQEKAGNMPDAELKQQLVAILSKPLEQNRETLAKLVKGEAKAGEKPQVVAQGPEVLNEMAEKRLTAALTSKQAQLAAVAGKDIGQAEIGALAKILAPSMVKLNGKAADLKKSGDKAFDEVATELRNKLMENKDYLNEQYGMKLNAASIAVLADQMAITATNEITGRKGDAPETFMAQARGHMKEFTKAKIAGDVVSKMENTIAAGSAESGGLTINPLRGFGLGGAAVHRGSIHDESERFTRLSKKQETTPLTQQETRQMERDRERLMEHAVYWESGPNAAQRELIGKVTSEAVVETISNPQTASLPKEELAKRIETTVAARLQEHKAEFDALGTAEANKSMFPSKTVVTSWENIKYNTGKDIFTETAQKAAEQVSKNSGNAYDQLKVAQAEILKGQQNGIREASAAAANAGVSGATPGKPNGSLVGAPPGTPASAAVAMGTQAARPGVGGP